MTAPASVEIVHAPDGARELRHRPPCGHGRGWTSQTAPAACKNDVAAGRRRRRPTVRDRQYLQIDLSSASPAACCSDGDHRAARLCRGRGARRAGGRVQTGPAWEEPNRTMIVAGRRPASRHRCVEMKRPHADLEPVLGELRCAAVRVVAGGVVKQPPFGTSIGFWPFGSHASPSGGEACHLHRLVARGRPRVTTRLRAAPLPRQGQHLGVQKKGPAGILPPGRSKLTPLAVTSGR